MLAPNSAEPLENSENKQRSQRESFILHTLCRSCQELYIWYRMSLVHDIYKLLLYVCSVAAFDLFSRYGRAGSQKWKTKRYICNSFSQVLPKIIIGPDNVIISIEKISEFNRMPDKSLKYKIIFFLFSIVLIWDFVRICNQTSNRISRRHTIYQLVTTCLIT